MSERHLFVNYDDETWDIEIKAYENVSIYVMETEGSPVETLVTTEVVPQYEQYVEFEMHIPAGTIYGFRVDDAPEYTDPNDELLEIRAASGKSPWPNPPPPPPAYEREDFEDRLQEFQGILSGDRQQQGRRAKPAEPTPTPTVTS
jgi:hypothetical protein